MRKRSEWKMQWELGSRPVFWLLVGVLAFGTAVRAGSPKEVAPISMPNISGRAQAIQELQYPDYPKDLQARFLGQNPSPKAVSLRQEAAKEWALASIGFFDVFGVAKTAPKVDVCSKNVIVAIVDTGIDYTHPDLKDNLWVNKGETGPWMPTAEQAARGVGWSCRDKSCNGLDDDNNGYADDVVGWDFVHDVPMPFDTHGHGSHIAGIIGGAASTGIGTSGVCNGISLMALKYYDNGGAGYNNLANTVRAIQYAVANGAQIINYSGGGADPAATERAAVAEAQRKGVLFVAAAGNDGRSNERRPYYPASYPIDNIIGVASVNKFDRLLPSSNFGKTVHVAAPGLMIMSTLPGGKYGTMSGTSQATAFVTGAAALLASQSTMGKFDYTKVKNWILEGARPMKLNQGKQLLAAGLLSLPGSVQAQQSATKVIAAKTTPAPEMATVVPPNNVGVRAR
ncbi:S8 family serine peptidase [bacterium]|nr:S8 family serine peptidase [bacterium]